MRGKGCVCKTRGRGCLSVRHVVGGCVCKTRGRGFSLSVRHVVRVVFVRHVVGGCVCKKRGRGLCLSARHAKLLMCKTQADYISRYPIRTTHHLARRAPLHPWTHTHRSAICRGQISDWSADSSALLPICRQVRYSSFLSSSFPSFSPFVISFISVPPLSTSYSVLFFHPAAVSPPPFSTPTDLSVFLFSFGSILFFLFFF